MVYVLIGVSKKYNNGFSRVRRRTKPAQRCTAYFSDENEKLHTKKLSKLEYFIYKYFKTIYKRKKFACEKCSYVFKAYVKNKRQSVDCPNCESD